MSNHFAYIVGYRSAASHPVYIGVFADLSRARKLYSCLVASNVDRPFLVVSRFLDSHLCFRPTSK